ncbi:hypothetical protein Y032_0020g38 [Ancylostoma ceylanicum]|nr:hypothetical protein Y032_0020g38 [Ancylostoma ceylanicum]
MMMDDFEFGVRSGAAEVQQCHVQQNQVVIQWCMNMCKNPLNYFIKIALPTSPLLRTEGAFRHCWEMLGSSHSQLPTWYAYRELCWEAPTPNLGAVGRRNSYNLYLLLLSLFDVFIGVSYIAVMSNKVLTNWTASYTLKALWVTYMVPMLTISHIAITASTYLITFAAIERYCITVNSDKVKFLQNHRKTIAFIAVMCGIVSKGTILNELTIMRNPYCIGGLAEWEVRPSSLVMEHQLFNKIWRFYFRLQEHANSLKTVTQSQDKQSVKQKKGQCLARNECANVVLGQETSWKQTAVDELNSTGRSQTVQDRNNFGKKIHAINSLIVDIVMVIDI